MGCTTLLWSLGSLDFNYRVNIDFNEFTVYAIAGAIFVRIFWMLDAASLPSLLTVGYSIKLVEFGSVVPINAVTVR